MSYIHAAETLRYIQESKIEIWSTTSLYFLYLYMSLEMKLIRIVVLLLHMRRSSASSIVLWLVDEHWSSRSRGYAIYDHYKKLLSPRVSQASYHMEKL